MSSVSAHHARLNGFATGEDPLAGAKPAPPAAADGLAIVGGGPKAIALAVKAKVLTELGIVCPPVHIFERDRIAANWDGTGGFTDGLQMLGTPPEKDLGFPYSSVFGPEVDRRMLEFSWTSFLIHESAYGSWIDRGRVPPRHGDWARYLRWAHDKVTPRFTPAEVTAIRPDAEGVVLTYRQGGEPRERRFRGVVLTGPGLPIRIPGSTHGWDESVLNGSSFWQRVAEFQAPEKRIAIIGGGETAASIVLSVLNLCPSHRVHLINRHGTIYTRGESYHENRLYTNPSEWQALDEGERLEFIRRTDRGVFSVAAKRQIDHAPNIRLINGRVEDVVSGENSKPVVRLRRDGRTVEHEYDRVIVAIGFDAAAMVQQLLGAPAGAEWPAAAVRSVDWHLRINATPGEPMRARPVNVHTPMLAALAQGPGFPNLSCLGILSDRILSNYVPGTRS